MALGAGALALKTTAVVVVLAALILPSLARCPSLGPEPPLSAPAPAPVTGSAPTPPAPAPGPGPPILCSDCPSHCSSTCASECSSQCGPLPVCDACRSRELEKCRACCGNGTCSCDCDTTIGISCYSDCYAEYRPCQVCQSGAGRECANSCKSRCDATCVKNI